MGGPHYDRNPEMQAPAITDRVIEEIKKEKYQFILINFANPDMVGHTGNLKAAIKAAEVLDGCVKRITEVTENKYVVMITADHGNFEEMISPRTGEIIGEHSLNPVPFYLVNSDLKSSVPQKKELEFRGEAGGFLFDIAPTILEYLELKKPKEMTGLSLLSSLGK
jgi:2,3-bisphosphoglycerate-independent phosphoglycerate mutase